MCCIIVFINNHSGTMYYWVNFTMCLLSLGRLDSVCTLYTLYNVKELYLVVVGLESYLLNKLSATGLEWVRDLDMQMSPILTPSSPTDKDTEQGKISFLALDQTIWRISCIKCKFVMSENMIGEETKISLFWGSCWSLLRGAFKNVLAEFVR